MNGRLPFDRWFPAVSATLLLLFSLSSFARAEAPMAKAQAPGFYRMMLGNFEVTALCDGSIDVDVKLLKNTSEPEIRNLLARSFAGYPKMPTVVTAYLVNTGSKLLLVDSGMGKGEVPTLGELVNSMKASGYDPAQVDAVLITHLHGDHIGGLLDSTGKPVFPKAVVYAAREESDYWLSTTKAERAPAGPKRIFEMARKVSAPYLAEGRWKTFENGDTPFPGIKAIVVPGHTPGHTLFNVSSDGSSLLITGDTVHNMAIQFTRPDVAIDFDVDSKRAVKVRRALFRDVANHKTLIAGQHLPFPGIGHIRAEGKGSCTWVPIEYSPIVK